MVELREHLQDVHDWICDLRQHEVQALHDKVEMLSQKIINHGSRTTDKGAKTGMNTSRQSRSRQHALLSHQTNATRESNQSVKSFKPIEQQESAFSFNCSPAQQKLLYEEIEMLREEVNHTLEAYRRAGHFRDNQSSVLAKER